MIRRGRGTLVLAVASFLAAPTLACPAAGTRVAYSDGREIRWAGAAPGDALLCLGEERLAGRARPVRRLAGLVGLPHPEEAALRAGLAAILAGPPGTSFTLVPPEAPEAREEWRREPPRAALFAGRELVPIRLSRTRTWPRTGAFLQLHYAIDPATGVLLQQAGTAGGPAGTGLISPVTALRVEPPS